MCFTKDDDELPIQLWLKIPITEVDGLSIYDESRHAISIKQNASVKELVDASAKATKLNAADIDIVFSESRLKNKDATLKSIGMYPEAEYYIVKRPPELESPVDRIVNESQPTVKICWITCTQNSCGIFSIISFGIFIVILTLSCYGFILYKSTGCRKPVCDVDGLLQCCNIDRFGTTCTPRQDLYNMSCALWQQTPRPCNLYKCSYTDGVHTVYELAHDDVFEGYSWSMREQCIAGIVLSTIAIILIIWFAIITIK